MSNLDKKHNAAAHDFEKDISVNLERRGAGDMPECLQVLSPSDFSKVGRKATMKMDLVLLPCLMAMYILYVPELGRRLTHTH